MPFDVYLRSLNPAIPFHNNDGECPRHASPEHDSEPLFEAISDYAREFGLGDLIDDKFVGKLKKKFHKDFSHFIGEWQVNSFQSPTIYEKMKTLLPPLTQPIVLYRGYSTGMGKPPEIGTTMDNMGLRSCSLSQGFADKFFTTSDANSFLARVDVLPGIHVLPMLTYSGKGIFTEFEVMVNLNLRVHVVDPTLILEGQIEMPPPPLDYKCDSQKYSLQTHNANLKKVTFYFILSEPGTEVEYYPNFEDPETKMKVGGGKAIRLNDENQLGGGNAEKIINAYIARHKKRRGTKKLSL